jgi:hypothetical protein
VHALGSRLNVGKRVGHAHRASRDGRSYVKKGNADGAAAAFVDSDVPTECRCEFFALTVVLHRTSVGFGVGEYFACRINNGGACAGGLAFLRSDVLQSVLVIGLDSVCEQACLRGQAPLNFIAQRRFPGPADGDVQCDCRHQDHARKHQQQLEEDPVGHFGASKRYPAPRTVFR